MPYYTLLSSSDTLMIIDMKVVGIGQCALDHIFLIDSYPLSDTKQEVLEWEITGGGPVATALVSLSRLGAKCRFYGITGDDEAGRKIADSLTREDVDISGLCIRPDATSQAAFIAVERTTGKRTIFWKRPSAEPLRPGELESGFLDSADFLLVDGLMAEASIFAAKKAKEKNVPSMLDAGRVRDGMIELAHLCDYVVCSEEFARELLPPPFDPEKSLLHMRSFGAQAVTITLGDKGSISFAGGELFHMQAFNVDATDTTGAGDVFHGGYIYGLLQRWSIRDTVRFASAFAALKCRKLGGRAGIPTLSETMRFLQQDRS